MKKSILCFAAIFLFATIGFSQTGRKITALATYVSSENGNRGGEIKLKLNGKTQDFVWDTDEGTGKLPIFQSNPKGFQEGAEWKIVYSKYDSNDSYLFLWSATFTGRVLASGSVDGYPIAEFNEQGKLIGLYNNACSDSGCTEPITRAGIITEIGTSGGGINYFTVKFRLWTKSVLTRSVF
ncbi:hypothetical protein BH10ACI1_BH10ACI1_04340 [soil metagenome]